MKQPDVELSAVLRLLVLILAAILTCYGYLSLGIKGVVCALGATLLALVVINRKPTTDRMSKKRRFSTPFLLDSAIFLVLFPFWPFAQSVGITPGVLAIYLGSELCRRIRSGKDLLASSSALVLLSAAVWIWSEAGKALFVVMPVDIPEPAQALKLRDSGGASLGNDVEFTPEGAANALETEIYCFGQYDPGGYSETEAAQTLARGATTILFPKNPWYKKSPPLGSPCAIGGAEAPQTPHVLSTTQIQDFPLAGIYHILRHVRGKPMIEAQILVGNDDSLTLALRRVNYSADCIGEGASEALISKLRALGKRLPATRGGPTPADQTKSPSRDAQETLSDMEKTVVASIDQSAEFGLSSCRPPFWRQLVTMLDILPPQVEEEERIANQTIYRLQGDTRLTEMIQFAVLEGMEKLSEEKLAQYYDETAKYDSSLQAFERALPQVLSEYDAGRIPEQDSIVTRLANILIRIGDMSDEVCGDTYLMKGAYAVAEQLSRDDAQRMTRMGYHYLIDADKEQLETDAGIGASDSHLSCAAADRHNKPSVNDNLGNAVSYFTDAKTMLQNPEFQQRLKHRYGTHIVSDSSWLYSNFAFAETMTYEQTKRSAKASPNAQASDKQAEEILKRAQDLSRAALACGTGLCASDSAAEILFSKNWDIRAASAWAAAERLARRGPLDDNIRGHLCNILSKDLAEGDRRLTLNNYIVVRDELRRAFNYVDANGRNVAKEACRDSGIDTSFAGLLLLNALKEYQDAHYVEALQFASHALQTIDSKGPLAANVALGYVYALTANQVRETQPSGETAANLGHAMAALTMPTTGVVDSVLWQASSLVNIRSTLGLGNGTSWKPCGGGVEPCAEKATDALPDNAYTHRTLSIVYLKGAKPEKAIAQLGIATRINRGDPILRYLYGVALSKGGFVEEANVQWKLGRLLDPKHWDDIREQFKKRL